MGAWKAVSWAWKWCYLTDQSWIPYMAWGKTIRGMIWSSYLLEPRAHLASSRECRCSHPHVQRYYIYPLPLSHNTHTTDSGLFGSPQMWLCWQCPLSRMYKTHLREQRGTWVKFFQVSSILRVLSNEIRILPLLRYRLNSVWILRWGIAQAWTRTAESPSQSFI